MAAPVAGASVTPSIAWPLATAKLRVDEQAIPAVEGAYREGRMPASLLPGVGGGKVIALPERTAQVGR